MKKAFAWLNRDETKAFVVILVLISGVIYQAFYSTKTSFSDASFLNASYNLSGVNFDGVMVNFEKMSVYITKSATVVIPAANIKVRTNLSENLSMTLSASDCKAYIRSGQIAYCDAGEILVRSNEDFLKWTKYLNEKKNLTFEQLKNNPVRVLPND